MKVTLDYCETEGALAPYLSGLRNGKAIASQCQSCGRTALPPEQGCPCGGMSVKEVMLAGCAEVVLQTWGSDGEVALVRFVGADTLSVARLSGFGGERHGRIVPDPDSALVLVPEECK